MCVGSTLSRHHACAVHSGVSHATRRILILAKPRTQQNARRMRRTIYLSPTRRRVERVRRSARGVAELGQRQTRAVPGLILKPTDTTYNKCAQTLTHTSYICKHKSTMRLKQSTLFTPTISYIPHAANTLIPLSRHENCRLYHE